ncbi:DUF58 domain-containing protein [Schlesneria paludicola]|uniref:DUF58 domain-containing protein n=1 Tax=Schlesneria paludicola TaxID=360056 RepID=UPI00029B4B40|nr:DUF58 domain-containing protein [Schlesneria paludicola]
MAAVTEQTSFLKSEVLSQIGNLELLSTRVVDGILSGKHRSTLLSGSYEFANHRAYSAGDEIRMIDWKVYARRDRYYIRQFEETTNLQGMMVVDCSGSMEFGLSTVSKLDYARAACACLSRLMLRQRDAVGLAIVGNKVESYLPPKGYPLYLQSILHTLEQTKALGQTRLGPNLFDLMRRLKRRGFFILFTDGLGDWDAISDALKQARLRGHEVLLFHVMAPEELSFRFNRWSRFECLEAVGTKLDLDPPSVREIYLRNLNAFLDKVRGECTGMGADYVLLSTDQDLGTSLRYYLGRRTARNKQ